MTDLFEYRDAAGGRPRAGIRAPAGGLVTTGLVRRFGSLVAVDGIDLEVARARSTDSWGPTAPGKSTLREDAVHLAAAERRARPWWPAMTWSSRAPGGAVPHRRGPAGGGAGRSPERARAARSPGPALRAAAGRDPDPAGRRPRPGRHRRRPSTAASGRTRGE